MLTYTIEVLPAYGLKRPVVRGCLLAVNRGAVARAFRKSGYMYKGRGQHLIVRRSALTWELCTRPDLTPYLRLRLEPEEFDNDILP